MVSAIDPTKPSDGVPAKKADLRANLRAAKIEIEELQVTKLENGMPFNMDGSLLTGAVLKQYTEVIARATIDGGELVIDLAKGNLFEVVLTESVSSMRLINRPPVDQTGSIVVFVNQDENGGWSLTWPASVLWSGGVSPVVSHTPNAKDIYALITTNAGSTWYGFVSGQMFA
jgi:hypothetical protein